MAYGRTYGFRYGGTRTWHADDQGFEPKATPDCVFLGKADTGALADLAADLSQEGTDMTVRTTSGGILESPSTRGLMSGSRTLDFFVDMNSTTATGRLFQYGSYNPLVAFSSAGVLTVRESGVTFITHTIANISATTQRFLISLATEPNPDTTGASDALRSELRVWNLTLGTFEQSVATHGAMSGTVDQMSFLYGFDITSGASAFDGTCYTIRLSKAFHSATETYRTFVAPGAQPTTAGETRLEFPTPTRESGIGDDGQYAGPVYALAAANARSQDLRLWTPIVNEVYDPDHAPNISLDLSSSALEVVDPNDTSWALRLPYLRRRPLPPNCNRLRVRVCISGLLVTSGETGTLTVRCYSMSQPGWTNRPSTSPSQVERYYRSASVFIDSSNDVDPIWLEFDNLKPARDNIGWTYLSLAFDGTAGLAACQVLAWTVEPVLDLDTSAGFGGGIGSLG